MAGKKVVLKKSDTMRANFTSDMIPIDSVDLMILVARAVQYH